MAHNQQAHTVVLDVVRQASKRYLSEYDIHNAEFKVLHLGENIAYELVTHIAKHRVDHTEVIRYPAGWLDALRWQYLNVWEKDPKVKKWLRFVPKRLLRKFIGNGVNYAEIKVTADAFYPHLPIGRDQEKVVVHVMKPSVYEREAVVKFVGSDF